ncbi:PH domain-containing protein [Microbulbifer magnicolonia]|uniref:PH domain-containing protein n=1 Tax=Microbulbifer magnicolonia TaxID=3109744 RepID=UPI002B406295|nr:PH domain-containing protein [Microbulbifer sp. GG15]
MAKESKHVIHFRQAHAKPGEGIQAWAEGYIGKVMGQGAESQKNGTLMVSQHRVIFCRKGMLGEVLESIELDKISSIDRRSRLGHYTLRVHTSNDSLEFKSLDKERDQALAAAIDAGRQRSQSKPAEPAAEDSLAKLERLAKLRDSGAVSDEEFQEAKKRLLANI